MISTRYANKIWRGIFLQTLFTYCIHAKQPMNLYAREALSRLMNLVFLTAKCWKTLFYRYRTCVNQIVYPNVLDWFNQVNGCQISPTTEETLFGITASSRDTTVIRKFNYTTLFMRHYIYSSKLNSLAVSIQPRDFISKLLVKFELIKWFIRKYSFLLKVNI